MHRFASAIAALSLLFVASNAAAQPDTAEPPPAAPAAGPAPTVPNAPEAKVPTVSIALERVGGVGYAKASASEGDSSLSIVALGVGGVTPNPFAVPRVGIDFLLGSGLTLGGAVGFTHISLSSSNGSKSEDLGSVFLYTLTPRLGYRIPLSEKIDLTPRAGLTFAGASFSPGGNSSGDASIFALAIGADAPFAFRLTDSFNLLAGAGIDYTVAATVTTQTSSTTTTSGPGGTTTSKSSKTEDVKGTLFSMQGWIGIGGYL